MKESKLSAKIILELEKLIENSEFSTKEANSSLEEFHIALLKKYYNAAAVKIDYHRHRVQLDIVVNDNEYDVSNVNIGLTTLPANLYYNSLIPFLKTCIETDAKSIAFYASLLQQFSGNNIAVAV